jgi:RND family efflux transporter MFP subunit
VITPSLKPKPIFDLANLTAQRMSDLYAKRSISQQEFDETTAKLKTSQAAYEMARARREQLNHRMAQDDAVLQEAHVSRSHSVIRAPFAGTITARNIEPGVLAIPGAPLLTIEAGNAFRLHVAVEESRLSSIHLHDTVPVFIDSLQIQITGRIAELSPTSDAGSHSYTVKIDLPANPALHAGQFGHVTFTTGNKQAITVPAAVLTENGQLQSVLVNDHGTARIRLLTAGEKRDTQIEILSGLQPGDAIIYPIPNGLSDGDRVEQRQ